ncbi:unnamed protein product [Sphagnum jensenii]|uniref:Uncharacterized protein n=1 Tax=Sphagnum jensenii TaxID=128206 RepID=A0ABP1AKL2_9BRYO
MRPVVLSMHYLALKRLLSATRRILNEGDARSGQSFEGSFEKEEGVGQKPRGERSFKASHKIKWSPEQELKTSKDKVHKSQKPEVEE